MYSYKAERDFIYSILENEITATYRKLIASRYFTKGQLEWITADVLKMLQERFQNDLVTATFIYLDEVAFLATSQDTYTEHERRFLHFYRACIDSLLTHFHKTTSEEQQSLIELTLEYFQTKDRQQSKPWSLLLMDIYQAASAEQRLYIFYALPIRKLALHQLDRKSKAILSYIYLDQKENEQALYLLELIDDLQEIEITAHFQLLKAREEWKALSHWFQTLMNINERMYFGSLQTLYDEMLMKLDDDPKKQEEIWERWLLAPHYRRFESLTAYTEPEKKQKVAEYLLPKLRERLHQPETVITYARLLIDFQKYEEAARFFLTFEKDPFRLKQEKLELLDILSEKKPDLAKAIYHQFSVRLVEKKTRAHYEQAVLYIKQLKKLYQKTNDLDRFGEYIQMLKKKYRTYRAFVEELKTIE
ncbi:hypothetical protein AJ85_17380 [Alkalihalobacillus alcalophilus ATCC 27647 = CGMCC 1.3604]|uniref:Uncharacterized protein n=1 Tax=Alkalihalobacillus alcalophilus ATCC 27647 = CGMCC 1.3604 TaxID=1218173 RepID=A0A094WN25_ALKAL|nr:hypothetical protein [Alkalihalobacillus alcalophilus]KGA97368.1 hypothetical protein BALCAV_0210690 [Alkalihalobacillus alcalophilus ATCC 27647 = CGMCC 1.3604]MED1562088.1 hypothetical protein [Alkalihalobacillus alcalophilus]THG89489.1 hypothetical protein AJ85_17380 [Alkalihalobacillus alcalophilus ATCC 27647 = CGMCC 1.3604]